jgi:hypothetical protein
MCTATFSAVRRPHVDGRLPGFGAPLEPSEDEAPEQLPSQAE